MQEWKNFASFLKNKNTLFLLRKYFCYRA